MSEWTITVKEREPTGYREVDRTYTPAELRELFSGGGDVVIPLLNRIEALEAACRVMAEECMAGREKHSSEVNTKRRDGCEWFRRWHDDLEVTDRDPLASKYIEEARNG